jgi:hypothetical protein
MKDERLISFIIFSNKKIICENNNNSLGCFYEKYAHGSKMLDCQ